MGALLRKRTTSMPGPVSAPVLGTVLAAALATVPQAPAMADDAGFLTRLLQDQLSDAGREVRITGFEGALSSRARIAELTIADDEGVWLVLRDASLDWNRAALLRRQLTVRELSAASIDLRRLPQTEPGRALPSPEAQPFSLPELPLTIDISRIEASSVRLGAPILGEAVELRLEGSARLADGEGQTSIQAVRRDQREGVFRLEGSFSNRSRALMIDLALSEEPGGIAARLLGIPDQPALALDVAGTGTLEDFAADIRLASDGEDRLTGGVTLRSQPQGPEDSHAPMAFGAEVSGDLSPLLDPGIRPFFGNEAVFAVEGLRDGAGRMELSRLDLRTRKLALSGQAGLASDGLPERLHLQGRIAAPEGGPVRLPLAGPPTMVETVRLDLDFDAARGPDWRAQFTLSRFDHPAASVQRAELSGRGRLLREAAGIGFEGDIAFGAWGVLPTDEALAEAVGTTISGHTRVEWVDGGPVILPAFLIDGQDYGLDGDLVIDGERLAGSARARAETMARFSALADRPLGGALEASLAGEYRLLSGSFDLDAAMRGRDLALGQAEADNLLRGRSQIDASVQRGAEGTEIRRLHIAARTLNADIRGWVRSQGTDLTLDLRFADLAVLGTQYGGQLNARGQLADTAGRLSLDFRADGRDLAFGQAELDELLRGPSELVLAGAREAGVITLDRLGLRARHLGVEASGRLAEGDSDLRANLEFSDLGALGPRYRGAVTAEARLREAGDARRLRIDAEVRNIALGLDQADQLFAGQTRFVLDGRMSGDRMSIDTLQLAGPAFSITGDALVDGDERRATLVARLVDLGIVVPQLQGPAQLDLRLAGDGPSHYRLDGSGSGPGGIDLSARGRIGQDLMMDLTLAGRANLALANAFLRGIDVQGPAQFDMRVNGPPRPESMSGTVTVQGGRLVAPEAFFVVEDIAGTARLSGLSVDVNGSARGADGGSIRLAGQIGLAPGLPADLRAAIDGLQLSDRRLYETQLSGELRLVQTTANPGLITGDLSLGRTELRIAASGLGVAGYVPSMEHRFEPANVRATRQRANLEPQGIAAGQPGTERALGLDVRVTAPGQIFVRGRGLDAELGGGVRLTGALNDIVPSGQFALLRGRLDLLGRRFVLSDGLLRLQGNLVPFIELTATTVTPDITANIILEGEADNLNLRFSSAPELPEEEIVARILFGRELGNLSAFQAAQLASALATLAGRGGNGVVSRLRDGFGLDDLDLSEGEDGVAGVRVGRYLTERVYTDVFVDAEGRSEVSINLDITPSLRLRGRTDNEGRSGIGIFYETDY